MWVAYCHNLTIRIVFDFCVFFYVLFIVYYFDESFLCFKINFYFFTVFQCYFDRRRSANAWQALRKLRRVDRSREIGELIVADKCRVPYINAIETSAMCAQ